MISSVEMVRCFSVGTSSKSFWTCKWNQCVWFL